MLKTISLILMAIVQTISGEATKRNEEKRSFLHHCHRRASFKRLVQENPNGKEHHKHNHERGLNKEYHMPRICPRAWRLRLREEREQQIISRAVDNTSPFPSRNDLSHLYSANSTASLCAPGRVYSFSHCSVTLNIAGNNAVQKSTSDGRRGYKCTFIE